MLSRLSLAQRVYGAFGTLIVLLIAVGMAATLGVQGISATLANFKGASELSNTKAHLVAEIDALHELDVSFRNAPSEQAATAFIEAAKALSLNDDIAMAGFMADPETGPEIESLRLGASAWVAAFDKGVAQENDRTATLAELSTHTAAMFEKLEKIGTVARSLSDLNTLKASGEVTILVLRSQLGAETFRRTEAQADFDLTMTAATAAAEKLDQLKAMAFGPVLKAEAEAAQTEMAAYIEALGPFNAQTMALIELQNATLEPVYVGMVETLDGLAAYVDARQVELGATGSAEAVATTTTTIILGGIAALLGLALAVVTGRWLSGAIKSMASNMRDLAAGNLDLTLSGDQRHELGQMAQALEVFRSNGQSIRANDAEKASVMAMDAERQAVRDALQSDVASVVAAAAAGDFSIRLDKTYGSADLDAFAHCINDLVGTVDRGITETGQVLSALADADLSQRMAGTYQGAFAKLKADTNAVAEKFSDVMGQLRVTSRQIKSATGEILSGANDLSERTTKQAATIEETSAAVEQISSTVNANAAKAEEAAHKTQSASRLANEGGVVMEQANAAMERITTSSSKISNIIGLIDDIAFQTNLLALNASVEAARAGDAGKGFAVVAVEVRRLAQSAASASSDVKVLIEQSASEVQGGSKLVADATAKLNAILVAVEENSTLMQAISGASRAQASAIDEVTIAIRQMDEMTQHNAALVEQTNAAIEQTESQASELDRIVDIFKIEASTSTNSSRHGIRGLQDKLQAAAKSYGTRASAAAG